MPLHLNTWGDHIKKRRLELRLTRKEAIRILNVGIVTLWSWEDNRSVPRPMFIPRILAFLGYVPRFVVSETIGQKIKLYRLAQGLSKENFAPLVGVHPSRVRRWEEGKEEPRGSLLEKIKNLLDTMVFGITQ